MTLNDGVTLFQNATNMLKLPLDVWNGLSIYNMLEAGLFISIISWFVARMIRGKSHNEHAIQQEDYEQMADLQFESSFANTYGQGQTTLTGGQAGEGWWDENAEHVTRYE